jgi:acetyl-CoA carboxylase, biotin carboxylase subunit
VSAVTRAHGFRRVLIANRGEIAARVIRTCARLGIETVLATSDADARSRPARLADMVIRLGPAPASQSYLDVAAVVRAAVAVRADAVHPGYGFLSENARLAEGLEAAGVTFIGPRPQTLTVTGDKLAARGQAMAAGIAVLPGQHVRPGDPLPDGLGLPVLVKAVGGGGGRGLRVVRHPGELADALAVASAEAAAAFGDPRVYLERYVSPARHVEVQILGDGERVIHLGDRDCSVQRRYQKLIEEAPAPGLPEMMREELHDAAVRLGRHLRYRGAGTVEFLVTVPPEDPERSAFYFLEVNARIQVEHPVTEAITGVDIVAEQIAIAEGRPLRLSQEEMDFAGHAIECRVNAEDPAAGLRPSPGVMSRAVFPAGSGIRVDTHVQAGSAVPEHYDSLLAKVITWGEDRDAALAAMLSALGRCEVAGVATNIALHEQLLAAPEFRRGGVDTGYLARGGYG